LTNSVAILSKDLLQSIGAPKGITVLEYPGLRTAMESDKEIVNACETFHWDIAYNHDGTAENSITTLTVRLPNTVSLATGTDAIRHRWSEKTAQEGSLPGSFQAIKDNNNISITQVNEETVITMNVNGYLGYNLQPGRGGTLSINAKANCDNVSDTIVIGTVIGFYENAMSFGNVGSEDDVRIKNPDLYLRKAVDRKDPLLGEEIAYTLTIANKGSRYANNVGIQDYLPEGICYKTGSTLILDPMFWEIGEPFIEGDCLSGGQVLHWSNNYANALTFPGTASGSLVGDSEDIYLRYVGKIEGNITLGVNLINGAKVTTTDTQDNNYDKEDEQEVQVPYPNLYVTINSPLSVEGGNIFDYTLHYGNTSRQCAEKAYLLITTPLSKEGSGAEGETGEGVAIAKLKALTSGKGESVYSFPCGSLPPTFNRDTPNTGGRTGGISENSCYLAVKVAETAFCSADGQRTLTMTMQTTTPGTATKLPAGSSLTAQAEINNTKGEGNPSDNYASSTTKVPAMDLWIEMAGTPEGLTPGLLPYQQIAYTITFGNDGNELSCANSIKFSADSNVDIDSFDFTKLEIHDEDGNPLELRTPQDTIIGTSVPVTLTSLGGNYIFKLGDDEVCLPGGARGGFEMYVRTKNNLPDSTPIASTVSIWEDSAAKEDTMVNNEATSSTMVYLADVMIEKTARVDRDEDGIFGSSGDSTTTVEKGQNIQYQLHYDNI
jgi:uncharacterized repeat protein (TIGR01451 family)